MKIYLPMFVDCNSVLIPGKWLIRAKNQEDAIQKTQRFFLNLESLGIGYAYLCPNKTAWKFETVKEVSFDKFGISMLYQG